MATFFVCHGAWSSGWAWKRMFPLLRAAGHELVVPSQTGLGERCHLAGPDVDLDTHVSDMLGVIEFEDLRGLVLVGHSYGGMVATVVADRVPERIARIIYLDAFVPSDGQSMLDLVHPKAAARMRAQAAASPGGWQVPPNPVPTDTSPEDVRWIEARRRPQPLRTLEQPVRLGGAGAGLPRTYVYCTRIAPGDAFGPFAARARSEPGWAYREIDASHSPHVTAPAALAALLQELAAV